ncbi:30S ribosomal protein S8 [Candidatus Saganbacteria bacterium]|nr:30S ribosomal protein S8 [Candidatus Saganbacteria bacterium]
MNDPIADMLIRIKNGQAAKAAAVDMPHSTIKEAIGQLLVAEGYLSKCEKLKRTDRQFLRLGLKYNKNKQGAIAGLKRVSRSGRRIYSNCAALPLVQSGFGRVIVSTSKGLMTDEFARQKKLGGEIIGYVW